MFDEPLFYLYHAHSNNGPVAELVERLHGLEEVRSSSLLRSTRIYFE